MDHTIARVDWRGHDLNLRNILGRWRADRLWCIAPGLGCAGGRDSCCRCPAASWDSQYLTDSHQIWIADPISPDYGRDSSAVSGGNGRKILSRLDGMGLLLGK